MTTSVTEQQTVAFPQPHRAAALGRIMHILSSNTFGDEFVDALVDELESRASRRNGSSPRPSSARYESDSETEAGASPVWESLLNNSAIHSERGVRDLLIFELARFLPAIPIGKLRTMCDAAEYYATLEPSADAAGTLVLRAYTDPDDAGARAKPRKRTDEGS